MAKAQLESQHLRLVVLQNADQCVRTIELEAARSTIDSAVGTMSKVQRIQAKCRAENATADALENGSAEYTGCLRNRRMHPPSVHRFQQRWLSTIDYTAPDLPGKYSTQVRFLLQM